MDNNAFIMVEHYNGLNGCERDQFNKLRGASITYGDPFYVRLSSIVSVDVLKKREISKLFNNNQELFPDWIIEYAWLSTYSGGSYAITKETYNRLVNALGLGNTY